MGVGGGFKRAVAYMRLCDARLLLFIFGKFRLTTRVNAPVRSAFVVRSDFVVDWSWTEARLKELGSFEIKMDKRESGQLCASAVACRGVYMSCGSSGL